MFSGNALKLACAVASVGLVSGCMVGPDYKKPNTTLPESFSATQPSSTQPAAATQPEMSAVDLTRWWETFNDAQLNKLVSDAVANNFDVQIAQARVRQARAQLDVTYGGLFPTVDGSASYSRARASKTTSSATFTGTSAAPGTGGGSNGGAGGGATFGGFNFPTETDLFQGGFDAGWEIDVFGGKRRAVESAARTFESQVDARRNSLITLLAEVARNYVLLRGYQYQLAIVDRNIAAQADTVQLQQQKLQAGISTDLTVAQAEALLQTTRAQKPPIQTNISQTIHRLGVLLGREPTALQTELETPQPIPVGPASVPPGLPSELLRRRPDIRQAERALAAATASVGVATAELFPKFSLNGSIGLSSAKFTNWGDSNSIFWSVGPSVQWRLFDAGAIRANIRVEEAATDVALLTYRQTVYQAVSDVEDSLVAYNQEQQRTKALQASVDANRRAVSLARQLNDAGVVDFLNVLTAQQQLFQAEDQLAQSQQTVSTNLVAVYKALGGGWETTELPPQSPYAPAPNAPATQPVASR